MTNYRASIAATVLSPMDQFERTMERLRRRYKGEFIEPKVTPWQRHYFQSGVRVEAVSPYGYVRRGTISCTTGWRPSLLLIHRRGDSGSSDLLTVDDVIVATIGSRSKRVEVPHDKMQVAVYIGEAK